MKPIANSSFWKNRKVLITGHTGFKGSWLSIWLEYMGAEVTGISLEPTDNSLFKKINIESKINHKVIDITNFELISQTLKEIKPEIVFHLAAQSLVINSYEDPRNTWMVNVMGSINIIESLRKLNYKCSLVMITTDKVYKNFEWDYSYRENDELGGNDPYSSSKAATELAIQSLRKSFFSNAKTEENLINISSARSGNVIGGGDWSNNRIVPDAIRSIKNKKILQVRNPYSTRPWLHVLEPLNGYLLLAQAMIMNNSEYNQAFNFAPSINSNCKVEDLIKEIFSHWKGNYLIKKEQKNFEEAKLLSLSAEKAKLKLGWESIWEFKKTVEKTVMWYKKVEQKNISPLDACYEDLKSFINDSYKEINQN